VILVRIDDTEYYVNGTEEFWSANTGRYLTDCGHKVEVLMNVAGVGNLSATPIKFWDPGELSDHLEPIDT
jgi:hypothetical protein